MFNFTIILLKFKKKLHHIISYTVFFIKGIEYQNLRLNHIKKRMRNSKYNEYEKRMLIINIRRCVCFHRLL